MSNQRPRSEFIDVDHASSPQGYVECMDAQHGMDFIQMYKRRARTLLDLQPGLRVLDVGSGTGEDACEIARLVAPTGGVIGLDYSQTMVDEAQQRCQDLHLPAKFVQGDARRLSFADNTFDRCYASKTFQHLPDPQQALAEMIRVTRPGGLMLIVDPDHGTHLLDTPYPAVTERFFHFRASGIRQPGIAHQMYALCKDQGLIDIQVEPLTWISTDYEQVHPLLRFVEGMRLAQEHGIVTREEAESWIAHVEESASNGRFFHAITYFITLARKPVL